LSHIDGIGIIRAGRHIDDLAFYRSDPTLTAPVVPFDQTGAHAPQTQPLQALKYKDITEESSEGIFSVLPQPEILVRKA